MTLSGFLRFMMFVFNGIICLAGAAIMVAGIWVKVDSDSMVDILSNLDAPEELSQVLSVGYLLIALGPMVLIIGLIGCCGAVRGSRFKLMVFFIIVFLVFVAEVAGVVASLVLKTDNLGSAIVTVIKENYGKQDEVTGPLDIVMTTLQCCGVNSFSDFTFSSYHNTTQLYPPHCCKSDNPCAIEDVDQDKIGCYTVIKNKIKNNQWCVVAALVGIVILEICSMVVTMFIFCRIVSKVDRLDTVNASDGSF